jgi:putative flippase GtrA
MNESIRKSVGQVFKAGFAGAVGTAVHYGILALFFYRLHFPAFLATGVGFSVGAITNYFLTRLFVFSSTKPHSVAGPRFFITALVGLCFNTLTMYLISRCFQVSVWMIQIFVTIAVFFLVFVINKTWSFRENSA